MNVYSIIIVLDSKQDYVWMEKTADKGQNFVRKAFSSPISLDFYSIINLSTRNLWRIRIVDFY